jgi:branched-chain amino acid transport system permease protein
MRIPTIVTPALQDRLQKPARIAALAGAALLVVTPFLPWAYDGDALDNMTVVGYPSVLQFMAMAMGIVLAGVLVGSILVKPVRGRPRVGWIGAAKAAGIGALVYLGVIILAISVELGGSINVEIGGWLALIGALLAFVGTLLLPAGPPQTLHLLVAKPWVEILAIAALMLVVLFAAAYALGLRDGGSFVSFITALAVFVAISIRSGLITFYSGVSQRHRKVLVLAAFMTAFAFPLTQNGSNANMSIATQVIIFAGTAMGLNIVVGLAGLLDLGYIAFLGAGAYVAAVFSTSTFATAHIHPPFIVIVLMSGCTAAALGLLIGSPTLRVSGDYLAIVTLAFGEIFRISMNNLDGQNGPNITHGPNGIPAIPDLVLFGFDFGEPHVLFGIAIGRFANYYFLLLVLLAIVILIFVRLNNSRIGRGWVAIREDEKAAEAMGVNVFGLKLFAFASGAFLAGVAGAIKAHIDVSVTPEQFVFLESAFLLAAIVLGGMGTVLGVLVGATLLKLMPEKLRFLNEYRLLIFGLLLIVMMRFRPEGLIPNQRRQLEFHEEDEDLVERIEEQVEETGIIKGAAT